MDPDTNLDEQLALARFMLNNDIDSVEALRLAELVESLHEWIKKGGSLPKGWKL